jgi:hypothetical protein
MTRSGKWLPILTVSLVVSGCDGGGSDGNGGNTPNNSPTTPTLRDSFPANVHPAGPTPFGCLAPGAATQAVMQKLNSFWQSTVRACACDSVRLANGCFGNGFVTSQAYGHIFYDAAFLDDVDRRSGSPLPADFFMAHEFGHNIQLALNLSPPGKFFELQADCLGGYYVGFQARKGFVSQSEVIRTFQFACTIGDPMISPWWASGAHGVCTERVAALQRGFDGYNSGWLPGQACP